MANLFLKMLHLIPETFYFILFRFCNRKICSHFATPKRELKAAFKWTTFALSNLTFQEFDFVVVVVGVATSQTGFVNQDRACVCVGEREREMDTTIEWLREREEYSNLKAVMESAFHTLRKNYVNKISINI